MSNLKCWWGRDFNGREALLVAKTGPDAARLAGIRPSDLAFKFERQRTVPWGVDRAGLYRNVGGAWVREQPAKGPPDPEDP